jgi:hypothetical protein
VVRLTLTPIKHLIQRPEASQNYTDHQSIIAQPIPEALTYLITLNVKYNMLICIQCKFVLKPTAIPRHFSDRHKTAIKLQKQINKYIKEFPFSYDHTTVTLPLDRSAPQPVIAVLEGHLCQACLYKIQSRDVIKKHRNKEYSKKRIANEELYEVVQLQSWFNDRQAWY